MIDAKSACDFKSLATLDNGLNSESCGKEKKFRKRGGPKSGKAMRKAEMEASEFCPLMHIPLPTGSRVLAQRAMVANWVTLLFRQSGLLHGISTSTSSFPLGVSVFPFLSTETAALCVKGRCN